MELEALRGIRGQRALPSTFRASLPLGKPLLYSRRDTAPLRSLMVGIKVSGSLVAVICLLAGIAAGQIQAQEATPQVRCKFRRGHMIGVCVSLTNGSVSPPPTASSSSPAPAPTPTPAPAPTPLPVPAIHKVTLTWVASTSAGVTGYNLYRSTTNGSGYVKIGSTTTQLIYVDASVVNATTYYYVVTAVDVSGESGYSNQITAVIP